MKQLIQIVSIEICGITVNKTVESQDTSHYLDTTKYCTVYDSKIFRVNGLKESGGFSNLLTIRSLIRGPLLCKADI